MRLVFRIQTQQFFCVNEVWIPKSVKKLFWYEHKTFGFFLRQKKVPYLVTKYFQLSSSTMIILIARLCNALSLPLISLKVTHFNKSGCDFCNNQINSSLKSKSQTSRMYTVRLQGSKFGTKSSNRSENTDTHTDVQTYLVGKNVDLEAVFRIHEILVWIRIRGSMPLTNGSGFGSFYFHHWPSRCKQKTNFKKSCPVHYSFKVLVNNFQR